jgi:DNA-binding PucR family transcriptional regulator
MSAMSAVSGGSTSPTPTTRLAAYDRDHHSDLVASLEAYLDHGGSLAESATVLYVHRNTLLARVHRIEQVLDLDLGAAGERLNLHVALKAYRLHCG